MFTKNSKNCTVLKHILALPTRGQKGLVSELQPFTFSKNGLGHPIDLTIFEKLWRGHFIHEWEISYDQVVTNNKLSRSDERRKKIF